MPKLKKKPPAKGASPQSAKEKELTEAKQKVLDGYLDLIGKKGMLPTRSEMIASGISRDRIRQHFGTQDNLLAEAKRIAPKAFEDLITEDGFTDENYDGLIKEIKKHKRFIITTAVTGCLVHEGFLASINLYCKKHNAKLLVLPASDPASSQGFTLDSTLGRESVVFSDVNLNSNMFLCAIKMSAKHIDPSTGMDRIGQRHGSFIYASPKQRLRFIPVSNVKHPHTEMTTGAITLPNYSTKRYMSDRTAYIANHDHIMGAIVVEIVDDKRYHFRQIQADGEGAFIDLGVHYSKKGIKKVKAEGFSLGDWHSGETDPTAKKAWLEVCSQVGAKRLFIHDGFNGMSINHHEKDQTITRARLAQRGLLSLKDELKSFAQDLDELASWPGVEEVVIVKSNHDVFLDRWLQDGEWTKDAHNYDIGVDLAKAMKDGHNPLQFAVETMFKLKNKAKIRWLSMDEDYFIARIQMGAHGHKGPNGSRGSIAGMERSYGQSVTGHTHSPAILRGAYQNGTSSFLKVAYTQGPTSWVHNSTLVYPNGMRQMINSFEGEWQTPKKRSKKK